MKLRFLIACIICALSMTRSVLAEFSPIEGVTLDAMLGGEKIRRIITKSPEIQVFRLGVLKRVPPPVKFRSSDEADVIAALTDVKNYGGYYLCDFDPGVKFRFTTDEGILDIVICFTCGEMQLFLDGKVVNRDIRWVHHQNSFSPAARRHFVSLAKKAFPADVKIQALNKEDKWDR